MVTVKTGEADHFITKPPPKGFLYLIFGTDAGIGAECTQKIIV